MILTVVTKVKKCSKSQVVTYAKSDNVSQTVQSTDIVYYRPLIASHIRSIEWHHCLWPWMTLKLIWAIATFSNSVFLNSERTRFVCRRTEIYRPICGPPVCPSHSWVAPKRLTAKPAKRIELFIFGPATTPGQCALCQKEFVSFGK